MVGLWLAGAAVTWTLVAAASSGGSPGPFVALVLGSAVALVIGWLLCSIRRWLVPAAIVGTAAVLALTTPDILSGAPLAGPFGYANANGAFFVQAAVAGLMLAAESTATSARVLAVAAAIGFSVVPFVAKSVTSAVLLLVLPLVSLSVSTRAGSRVAVAVSAGLFMAVLVATLVLGSTYAKGDRSRLVDRIVDSTLDERRAALWHEALVMMREHPLTGVGLGGFQALSPTARSDRDARWAHNSYLQQGAETGLIGLVLLVALFIWGFASLGARPTTGLGAALGAAALAALGIHACVDYILHFPAVPITTAALVGFASAARE
jgi:O-antigen ligase